MRAILSGHAGLLVAGLLTFILMGAGQSLYGPALPAFGRAFALSTDAAGVLISAHWVGAAGGIALMFVAAAHVRPRHVFLLMAAGTGLIATEVGWAATLAGAVVYGVGYGCATVIYNARVLVVFGRHGPAMLALLNAVFAIGAISAPLLFILAGSAIGATWAGLAGLALLTALVAGGGGAAAPVAQTGHYRLRLPILAFGALAIGLEACLIGLGPVALIAVGAGEAQAAQLLSLFFAGFLVSRMALVAFASSVAPFILFIAACSATSAALALIAATGALWPFVAAGASSALFFPAFYMTAVRQMGDHPRVSPTIIAAGLAGGILSPLVLALVMARMGDAMIFTITAGASFAAAAAAFALRHRMAR